jgi:hypothetical protein
MSSAPASAAQAHDVHAFTGEPVQVLPADEPRTPGWLPLLGIALFTGAAVVLLVGQGATSPPSAVPVVKPDPAPLPTAPSAAGTGSGAVADAIHKLSPEQMAQMRKRLEERNAKGAPSPGRTAPAQ